MIARSRAFAFAAAIAGVLGLCDATYGTFAIGQTDTSDNARPLPASHNCVETTITKIGTRLQNEDPKTKALTDVPGTGYGVDFAASLPDPYYGSMRAVVVTYGGLAADALIAKERVGDRVQLCAVAYPSVEAAGTIVGKCDPTKDPRGRIIRVYDEAKRFVYVAANAEHLCGGA